jgi:O-antigen ligase
MIVLSVFLLCGYVFSHEWKLYSFFLLIWVAWLLVFLIIMESLTGVVIGASVSILLLIFYAVKRIKEKKAIQGIVILLIMVIGIIGTTICIQNFYHKYFPVPDKISYASLDKTSANGNRYSYDSSKFVENGHYVNMYLALPELKSAWNKKSHIAFDSLDKKGNGIKYTLIRYLASMNLRKDSVGFSKLSPADIVAIEEGIPNYNFTDNKMDYRIYQVLWEIEDYQAGGDINGHSVTQRMEFWKAAIGIIKQHWFIGVGTGDVKNAFATQYDTMHSRLKKEFRLRAHNQFLEIGVGFGIIGMLWLLFSLIYPAIKMKKFYSYTYVIFWLIFLFSMINEDTLESQAGVTFFAFFNSFFLFIF